MDLSDCQFILDDNIVMTGHRSRDIPFTVVDIDTGNPDPRTQDADNPVDDAVMMGVDYFTAPVWTFTMSVRGATAADSLAALGRLKAAWRPRSIRRAPGAVQILRYRLHGRERRVYGRGRKFSEVPAQGLRDGLPLPVLAQFQLADPFVYDDTEASLHLGLVTDPGEGLTWPITFPITFGQQAGLRQGVVNVGGDEATPFRVEITGPITGHATSPKISGPGWRIDLPGLRINYDETVTIDTRKRTVTKNGISVAHNLTRRSSLAARLMPGSQEIKFGCTDPTNTAAAQVYWRPAHWSI